MEPLPARNERNVLLLTGAGHFTTHFFELMFPTLAVALARQADIPFDVVLGWSFVGYLMFGLAAVPAGLLADRMGGRLPLLIALFGLGVASLAASEVDSGRALSVCLAAMGAFAGVYHPIGTNLIGRTITARGNALGFNSLFGYAAIALTPVVTALLCMHLGWQNSYRMVGYVMCATAVACAFLPIEQPTRTLRPAVDRAPVPIAWRPLAVLFLAAALAGVSYRGNTLLQPAYFAQHVSELGYGAATSIAYALGVVGLYVGSRLADQYDLRRLYLGFHAASLPALLAMTVLGGAPLVVCTGVFVFFTLGMQPIENTLFAQFTPPHRRATFYGLKSAATFGVGSLAVFLVRWADGVAGLSYAIVCLAGVVVLIVAAAASLVAMDRPTQSLATPGLAVFPPLEKGGPPGGYPL